MSAAIPELFVVTVEPLIGDVTPLPAVVVKVTTTPWTGLPFASRTGTDGAGPRVAPTVARLPRRRVRDRVLCRRRPSQVTC